MKTRTKKEIADELRRINDELQAAAHDVVIKGRAHRQNDLWRALERLSDFVFNLSISD